MLAARKSSSPFASRASLNEDGISEYSTTLKAPFLRATTPTDSAGSVFFTTLTPVATCFSIHTPINTGSPTLTRQLSTPYACKYLTPRRCKSSNTDGCPSRTGARSAAYKPPLPSGAVATLPGSSSMILPSFEIHGSVPCSKKITLAGSRPKKPCSRKNVSVGSRVGPDVIMYHGTITWAPSCDASS